MEIQRLAELLKQYAPAHFNEVCMTLDSLSNELEYAKMAMSRDLMNAQNHDDYVKAREILDAQEALSQESSNIQELLHKAGFRNDEQIIEAMVEAETDSGESIERPDYNLYNMDDTVAYDIEDTEVTFKRPAAFSYKGKRYAVVTWKNLLSKLCDELFKVSPETMRSILSEERQPGKYRVKMSTNKSDLRVPVRITGSDIWIETNMSASDTRKTIIVLLNRYGIPTESVKVFFRRDLAALHVPHEENV